MYNALKPQYHKTGEMVDTPNGPSPVVAVSWQLLGQAKDMEDAKAKYGGHPVLSWINPFNLVRVEKGGVE